MPAARAPVVDGGELSLTCCKPVIRAKARPGDIILGYKGRHLTTARGAREDGHTREVLFVCRVTNKKTVLAYCAVRGPTRSTTAMGAS